MKPSTDESLTPFQVFVWSAMSLIVTAIVAWAVYLGVQYWPFEKEAPAFRWDAWNARELPILVSEQKSQQVNQELKIGPVTNIGGLSVQWLDFQLPQKNLHAWSPDGQTIYATHGDSVIRIDVANWRITHRIQLSKQFAEFKGLALTSEGIVVALRDVQISDTVEPRTGRRFERRSFRVLVVLNPNDLQVVRQFIGPSHNLAGSPQSPVVCVVDDGTRKLVDIRSGKVLDEGRWIDPSAELLMSPDGKTLYDCGFGGGPVDRTDITNGKFRSLEPLEPSEEPIGAAHDGLLPTLYSSPDGRRLAISVADNLDSSERGYSIIDVAGGSGPDIEAPLWAGHTTSFTFVGRNNRCVANCGIVRRDNNYRVEDFDLVLLQRQESDIRFQLDGKSELEASRLSGSPISDYVLVNTGQSKTAWVKLPPDKGEPKPGLAVEKPVSPIRGFVSEEPLEFEVKEAELQMWQIDHPQVEMPADAQFACSADGSRLYVADLSGRITMFDAQSLREIRRVELGDQALVNLGIGDMHTTKAGLLVRVGVDGQKFLLLDDKTLNAIHSIDLKQSHLDSASPSSNWICTINPLHELSVFDVRDGKLIVRVTPRQMERYETSEGRSSARSTYIRGAAAVEDDATVIFRYGAWHVFSVKDDGVLEHVSLMIPSMDGGNAAFSRAYPLPKLGLVYMIGEMFDLYEYPKLVRTTRMEQVQEQRWGQILGVTPNGVLYLGDSDSKRITAYDVDGKAIFAGDGTSKRLNSYDFLPLPDSPGRVFVHSSQNVYAIDLKPVE